MPDPFRRLWDAQDALHRISDPLAGTRRYLDLQNQIGLGNTVSEVLRRESELKRALSTSMGGGVLANVPADVLGHRKSMAGAIEGARHLGLFEPGSDARKAMNAAVDARRHYHEMFRLPDPGELDLLSREAMAGTRLASGFLSSGGALQTAMAQMKQPWLLAGETLASARAFSDIVAIGRGIEVRGAFDPHFARSLRSSLGDWRDLGLPDTEALVNPILRTGFYRDVGVDPALTEFTLPAFDEGLRIAGLVEGVVEEDDKAVDDGEEDGEEDFARSNRAFDMLTRLETRVRAFIVQAMLEAYGEQWMKMQLPPQMLDDWTDKREKAIASGQDPRPLIEYADFTHYKLIIERRDNWKKVFQPVFRRPGDVAESFQRLFPVRIATMHSRIITQEDELLLVVETRRLTRAMLRKE